MMVEKVLPSPNAVGTVDDRLHYLYARKTAIDALIRSLEDYWRCADAVPRKAPGRITAAAHEFHRIAL